jgi:N-glycosylase/DNA lyase
MTGRSGADRAGCHVVARLFVLTSVNPFVGHWAVLYNEIMSVTLQNWIEADQRQYRVQEYSSAHGAVGIKDALENGATGILQGVTEENKEDIFYMLCFCLAVPQSKAVQVNNAIEELRKRAFLSVSIPLTELSTFLRGKVRFHNNKARYLVAARKTFIETDFWEQLVDIYKDYCIHRDFDEGEDPNLGHDLFTFLRDRRKWLVKQFKGIGLKEASHFLRNIGMSGLAILDVHIINGLRKRKLIPTEKTLTNSTYCDIEDTMKAYTEQVGISIDELDLLLWSQKTGFVFK